MNRSQTPVRPGDEVEVTITDRGEMGDGVGLTEDGFALFVEGTSIGDRVRVRVECVRATYGTAHVVRRLE